MKPEFLDPLMRIADERKTQAATELADRRRALDSQEGRLAELKRYAEEYGSPAPGMVRPADLVNRVAFRARIDSAVATQQGTVQTVRDHCEVDAARLLLASRETQVLEKLAASYRKQESTANERKEQRDMDDLANRTPRAKPSE